MYDVIIIGGGPAGLSAGLVLGRSRRKVLICDTGEPRNKRAQHMHGYLTRDGLNPLEFLQLGREELLKYDVLVESRKIVEVNYLENHFEVIDSGDEKFYAKKILIATGIVDNLPDLQGIESMYGKSVFHCPYCDGWEIRDKKLAAYANGKAAYVLGFSLKTWSPDVIICTDGNSSMRKTDTEKLISAGIKIYTQKIERLEGEDGYLNKIIFKNGESIERDAIFFSSDQYQRSALAEKLGCSFNSKGSIKTNQKQETGIEGVFVAGDAAKDMKFVIVAAAEGARAGVAINISLQEDERNQLKNSLNNKKAPL